MYKYMYAKLGRWLRKHILSLVMRVHLKRDVVLMVDNFEEMQTLPLDNFSLFQYLYSHPEFKWKPVYVINKDNVYADGLKKRYGNNILLLDCKLMDIRFFWALMHTRFVCDAFQLIGNELYEASANSTEVTTIFTQHGITYFKEDFIKPNIYGHRIFDKVMVSNDFEKEIYLRRGEYGEKDIIRNGLFRWDSIKKDLRRYDSREILVFFTYRAYLRDMSPDEAKRSAYFRMINEILHNPGVLTVLEKHNLKVKIAIHHVLRNDIDKSLLDTIDFITEKELAESRRTARMLITDYSALCFEFMQQDKPVLFFHIHDEDACRQYPHVQDLIDPYEGKREYLYRFVDSIEQYIEEIDNIALADFKITDEERTINSKFYYYTENFCERFAKYLSQLNKIED